MEISFKNKPLTFNQLNKVNNVDLFKKVRGKRVLVMGLGLLGGGVTVTNWLIKHAAKVRVTDLKTEGQLKPSLLKIKSKKVDFILGKHRESDFEWADIIIQNPAVPKESKYLKIARKDGAQIENEATIFFKLCPAEIVGVTGTRGKSTTAVLIYQLLKVGFPKRKIWLAGNIKDIAMLEILDKIKANDLVVLELSSWHLELLGEYKISPHLAVITNIYPDHLNRYKGLKNYIAAKKNIFRWQNKNNFVILNKDNSETKKMGKEVKARRFWFSKKPLVQQNGVFLKNNQLFFRRDGKELKMIKQSDISLPGVHNLENVLAAVTMAGIYRVSAKNISQALKNFRGLKERLELIREIKGVKYYNDTTATTPEATIAALRTLARDNLQVTRDRRQVTRKIILIAGGSDKGLAFDKLAKEIKKYCKAVVLLSGVGTVKIKKQLLITRYSLPITGVSNMVDAIGIAQSFAKKGDIILLSPACASFGLFTNEFERGGRFREMVEKLK